MASERGGESVYICVTSRHTGELFPECTRPPYMLYLKNVQIDLEHITRNGFRTPKNGALLISLLFYHR